MHVVTNAQQIHEALIRLLGTGYPTRLSFRPDALRKMREKAQLSQSEVADRSGVKQPKISDMESPRRHSKKRAADQNRRGDREIPRKVESATLYALAIAIGCELSEISEDSGAGITAAQITDLQQQLLSVESIRTLIRPGENTRLRDIYHRTILLDQSLSPAMNSATQSQALQCDALKDLRHAACVVLGTAGQGKSVLLRYLTIQEALSARSLPCFLELRLLQSERVIDYIFRRLKNLKVCDSQSQLMEILRNGHVSLLFDAFDELPVSDRGNFLNELAELNASYPKVRIVISSRPDSGILHCDWLHAYSLLPLKLTDVESLIRIYADDSEADSIVSQVKAADFEVQDLLRSPIFVVLLVIKFRYSRSLPDNTIAFYRDLFDALLRRHNSSESGMKREVRSGLSPFRLEQAFQGISYLVHKRHGDQSVHIRAVEAAGVSVAERMSLSSDLGPTIVRDIMHITNLMLEEAGECFFIHKTVKEYYAASRIAEGATEKQAEQFYRRMLTNWREWSGVLRFLEHLDRKRYLKYFAIPELKRFAPFETKDIARSFTTIAVSRIDDELFPYNVELHDTESHAFHHPNMISYGVNLDVQGLQIMFGTPKANSIEEELDNTLEVILSRDDFRESNAGKSPDYSPIIDEIGNHLSGEELPEKLKSWEEEVLNAATDDDDFDFS